MKAIDVLVEYDELVKDLTVQNHLDSHWEALRIQREKYRELDVNSVELQ